MSPSVPRRLATVVSTALLGAMLLGVGSAVAATPGWKFTNVTVISPVISPGADAGYSFTVTNTGKSNISQAFLLNDSTQTIDYIHFDRSSVVCNTAPLKCTLGALNPGDAINFVIAYTTPSTISGNYTTTFYLNGTGNTTSDGGTSHGDSLLQPMTVNLNASQNFAGGFQLPGGGSVGDNQGVGRGNIQGSNVSTTQGLIPVTIQDGITTYPGSGSDPCGTYTCVGDWTQVQVGDGTVGPIEVKLLIYGKSIKGNIVLSNFALWHDGSNPNPITLSCSASTAIPMGGTAECVTATMLGTNVLLDAWLTHNGTLRGLNG